MSDLVICVDIGSTYTKGVLLDTQREDPWLGTVAVPTTNPLVGTGQDVVEGLDHVSELLLAEHGSGLASADIAAIPIYAASSAGGGLRIAVVGYESDVTAEAGRRAALSAGGKITQVHAGLLTREIAQELVSGDTDLILLVGGTDGGNAHVLVQNAATLGQAYLAKTEPTPAHSAEVIDAAHAPVVVAGNSHARNAVVSALATGVVDMSLVDHHRPATLRALSDHRPADHKPLIQPPSWVAVAANVLPTIGTYEPESARLAIRESFLRHVIRGKGLSTSDRFVDLVHGATPDMVLRGVEVLAGVPSAASQSPEESSTSDVEVGDVLVVDVGGATTDVYSVITPEGEDASLRKEVVAPAWHTRTVEGDLGMRWSAASVVVAAERERLLPAECDELRHAAEVRSQNPAQEFSGAGDAEIDREIARLAVTCALRRHARPINATKAGRDLRNVGIVVGSGGVLRHHLGAADTILVPATQDHAGGWRVPRSPEMVIDTGNRLLAAGLLAQDMPAVAERIAGGLREAASASGTEPRSGSEG